VRFAEELFPHDDAVKHIEVIVDLNTKEVQTFRERCGYSKSAFQSRKSSNYVTTGQIR